MRTQPSVGERSGDVPSGPIILKAAGLSSAFGDKTVLHDAALELVEGSIHGLVGCSGSGKSVLALSILNLLEYPGRVVAGSVRWKDRGDLLSFNEGELNTVRGREIAMLFQNPAASLNPMLRIGRQFGILLRHHFGSDAIAADLRAREKLELVGFENPRRILDCYPHELSGGMAQRAALGIALACDPALLIADEPTSALDAVAASHFASLLRDLAERSRLTVLLISHDLGLIAQVCSRISIVDSGTTVESGTTQEIIRHPREPGTRRLVEAALANSLR